MVKFLWFHKGLKFLSDLWGWFIFGNWERFYYNFISTAFHKINEMMQYSFNAIWFSWFLIELKDFLIAHFFKILNILFNSRLVIFYAILFEFDFLDYCLFRNWYWIFSHIFKFKHCFLLNWSRIFKGIHQ